MKLKVGQKIKILRTRAASWLDVGSIYTVGNVKENGYPTLVESRSPNIYWSCDPEDYEIVDNNISALCTFKKGDVVIHLIDADKKDCYGVVTDIDLDVDPITTAIVHVDWYKKANKDFVVRGTYFESSLAIYDIIEPIKVGDYVNFKDDPLITMYCVVKSISGSSADLDCYLNKTNNYYTTLTDVLLSRLVIVDNPNNVAEDKHIGFKIGDVVDHKDWVGKTYNKTYGVIREFTTYGESDDAAIITWYFKESNHIKNETTIRLTNLVKISDPRESFIPHTKTKTEHEKDSNNSSISEVCRSSWTIEPGKRSTGTPIQSGGSKATVVSGHVSYKAVTG